jgi:Flp pilus assembly protein TadD/O-antigen ligase
MTERHGTTLDQTESGPPEDSPIGRQSVQALLGADLATIADRVAESCVLLAVVLMPLFFAGGTSIPADAHKSIPLIAIAAIAAAAWLVGTVAGRGATVPSGVSWPPVAAGLSVLAAYAVGTIFSIHPLLSFVGTLDRSQGLLTHAAYAVLFLCAATRLRRSAQIERLLTVLIVGSLPAALYGIAQQVGIDPLPSAGDISTVQWPVRSSFGNHVFFGAYLVVIIPLTAAAFFQSLERDWRPSGRPSGYRPAAAIIPVLVAGLAYLGYLAAGARKPSLFALMPALLAAYALLGVALDGLFRDSAWHRARTATYGLILALQVAVLIMTSARGALLGVFAALPVFALLAARRIGRPRLSSAILACVLLVGAFVLVLNIPGGPLQSLRGVHALNRIANVGEYASESSGAGRLLIWHGFANLLTQHPSIGNTWGGVGRDLVGYGPESQGQAFEAVFPLKLRVETAETYTWDSAHSLYLDTLVDAGVLALLAFAVTIILFFARALRSLRRRSDTSWLTIGLICAVVAQLVEGIFGLEAAGSLAILWVVLGLGAGTLLSQSGAVDEEEAGVEWRRPALLLAAGLAAAFAVALVVDLTEHPTLYAIAWLLGICGGIGALVAAQAKRVTPDTSTEPSGNEVGSRWLLGLAGAAVLLALSTLLFPWQTESAAIAETAGFRQINRTEVTQGLGFLQQAARTQGYEPKYREDLAVVYFALAQRNAPTGAPGYVPSGSDALTIDPTAAQSLGRDQLFGLGVLSLQGAESLEPLDPYLHELIGNAYLQWGKTSRARAEFLQAQRLSHENPRYMDDLALVALAENRPQSALAQAQQAMGLDPTFWFSYYTRALVYDQLQQGAPARADARTALDVVRAAKATPSAQQLAQLRQIARDG